MASQIAARNCHHCNLPLIAGAQAFRVWCTRCSTADKGICRFCKGDVLEPAHCWEVERMLDLALAAGTIGQTAACGNCGTKLGVNSLTDTKAVLICSRCGRMLTLTWTWARKERGGPPVKPGPDDPSLPAY